MHQRKLKRRSLLKAASALGGAAAFEAFIPDSQGQTSEKTSSPDGATSEQALNAGTKIATSVAACAPLGIKATLNSAHLAPDQTERLPLSKLSEQYIGLYRTEDFLEGRRAEAEGRPPVYRGR